MKKLTKKQRETYIKKGGIHCPFCGDSIVTDSAAWAGDTDRLYEHVHCMGCEAGFTETYKLADITVEVIA